MAIASFQRVNRPAQLHTRAETNPPVPAWRRALVALVIALYLLLVLASWTTGSELLSAACVALLVTAVLAQPMLARKAWAWVTWLFIVSGVLVLTAYGHGRIAFDLIPVLINLALAILFGLTLRRNSRPLIARAICAIEGPQHLSLPRVAGYARALTIAWTCLFLIQAFLLVVMLVWWLPSVAANERLHFWGMNYLHIGGYLLPALFMGVEYAFRRWYLRHLPHVPLHVFLQKLVQNWHGLLRDSAQGTEGRS
jgi:magnesium-transporting ATPase (P-type)